MEVSIKACWSFAVLLLTICTSSVLTASLQGSFKQLDVNFAVDVNESSSAVKTPALDSVTAPNPGRDTVMNSSISCSTQKATVTLQPTSSTVYAAFTSTKTRVVKRAVVSTETVFTSTATATQQRTVTVSATSTQPEPVSVSATPTSEVLQSTVVVSTGVQFDSLSSALSEFNEINSTLSATGTAVKTMTERMTNIIRRVVTMTMGVLLTPIALAAQHLSQN